VFWANHLEDMANLVRGLLYRCYTIAEAGGEELGFGVTTSRSKFCSHLGTLYKLTKMRIRVVLL
jgi:hypothetical protein